MTKIFLISLFSFASAAAHAAQQPEAVFAKSCAMCHNGQLPTAPQKGDSAAWKPRLEKGQDALLQSVLNGLSVMPPKGLCSDCSNEELDATIRWMTR
ncbi:c-type cytochrome [Pseudomonas laurentiana]